MSTDIDGSVFKVSPATCFHFEVAGVSAFDIAPKHTRLVEGDTIEIRLTDDRTKRLMVKQVMYPDRHKKLRRQWPLLALIIVGEA